ncbi:hypothetical protein AB0L06_16760 [Spirillospora sp. NPDC052269]
MRSRVRFNATGNLTLVVVCFAVTVVALRGYLWLTGYPQVGGKTLHIAHLLWGGLAVFSAAVLFIMTISVRATRVAALLVGVGWGLFMDEVGKFITKNNDYFYRPAAAIIYLVFLVCLTLLVAFRHENRTAGERAEARLSQALEVLPDLARGRLTAREATEAQASLDELRTAARPEIAHLAEAMCDYVDAYPSRATRSRLQSAWDACGSAADRFLRSRWCAWTVAAVLAVRAVHGLLSAGITLATKLLPLEQTDATVHWITHHFRTGPAQPFGSTTVGLGGTLLELVIAVGLWQMLRGRRSGRTLALAALVLLLGTVDVADFYYNQFRATAATLADLFTFIYITHHSEQLATRRADA